MNFRFTQRGLTIAVVALTAAVVVIGITLAGTSRPGFCARCESHEPIVAAYHGGSHNDVNCELCHSKPGPFFFLTAKMEALEQPIAQLTGDYEEPILASVLNQSCRQCHADDKLFGVITTAGIRVQHEHLIEAGFLCIRCHSTTGHPDAVPMGSRTYPSMDQCLMCHNNEFVSEDGEAAVADCELCHAERGYGATPASHAEPDWDTRHGSIGILSTCSSCHDKPDSCRRCHNGIEMPHRESWLSRHGARVGQVGKQACKDCHDIDEFCETCHQVKMPHPGDFVVKHPGAAERAGQTCFNCHGVANCQACHEVHVGGDPRAHDLFKAQKWTPAPTPSPTPGATL